MSRSNIFEILAKTFDIEKEVNRIDDLFDSEEVLVRDNGYNRQQYTIKNFVDTFCFADWKNRGHCIDMDDFLETINYDNHCGFARLGDIDDFLLFIEVVFNCWKLAELYMNANDDIKYSSNFYLLSNIMTDCLSYYNHAAFYDENTEQVLVIENNPAVTAVAEIVEANEALTIIRYNHRTLHGDIGKKKAILLELGAKLEPNRNKLSKVNSTLEDGIFFMLNNLNLRHNNTSHDDKNYKELVAQMGSDTLEDWYDELYQMILLAFLEIDQLERNEKVKNLKKSINGGTT